MCSELVRLHSRTEYQNGFLAAYDGNKSWSEAALPFVNPCWNTADNPNATFQDGGLPCVFCPVDIDNRLFHGNVSIANEFCEIDAIEDTLTVTAAVKHLRAIASSQDSTPFYLAVGVHKVIIPLAFLDSCILPLILRWYYCIAPHALAGGT